MQGLRIEDFDLTEKVAEKDWIVEYEKFKAACLEVERKKDYTVCLFFLRPKYGIPLHDHPGMHGAMKILFGSLQITTYTAAKLNRDGESPDTNPSGSKPPEADCSEEDYTHKVEEVTTLTPDSPPCMVTPTTSNIHELKVVSEPVGFLDVLMPSYAPKQGRDCHYYKRVKTSEDGTLVTLKKLPDERHGGFYCTPLARDNHRCGCC